MCDDGTKVRPDDLKIAHDVLILDSKNRLGESKSSAYVLNLYTSHEKRGAMDQGRPFRFAVDIPIPPAGLGPMLPILLGAVQACGDDAVLTVFGVPPAAEVRRWFNRTLMRHAGEARRFEQTFRSIGARRVRL